MRERERRFRDRTEAKSERAERIASQASSFLMLLNAGGLAAVVAWFQSLPSEGATACDAIVLPTLAGTVVILSIGAIAVLISYFLRYRASVGESGSVPWILALAVASACFFGASSWTGYRVVNCEAIASDERVRRDAALAMYGYEIATDEERNRMWDGIRQRDDSARSSLDLAISAAKLREFKEVQERLAQAKQLIAEFNRLSEEFGAPGEAAFAAELRELGELQIALEKELQLLAHRN
jgi:hypothetical protein